MLPERDLAGTDPVDGEPLGPYGSISVQGETATLQCHDPCPDLRPTFLDLGPMLVEGYSTLLADLSQLRVSVEIVHVVERFDDYAQPIEPEYRTLRTGNLVVTRDQLYSNNWPQIGLMIQDEGPTLRPDRAAAVLKRYVSSWRVR